MILNKKKALQLIELLNKSIKNPKTSLKYKNRFTLLISVVLSAQCTDVNVNNVTKNIYQKYYRPEHFVDLGINKIKKLIKRIGLFNTKAKNIYHLSKIILDKYTNTNIKTIFNEITHLGEGVVSSLSSIENTIIEFYLISLSNNIYSMSIYEHGSGFSKWCAETYNIPYICKFIG